MPQFLKTTGWEGYSRRKNRTGQTEILTRSDRLTNTTQNGYDTDIAGTVDLGHFRWTFREDASVPSIRQKLIDQDEIEEVVFEDVKDDKTATVISRFTANRVRIIDVQVAIDEQGNGTATATARCRKATWERITPDGTYTQCTWAPNDD